MSHLATTYVRPVNVAISGPVRYVDVNVSNSSDLFSALILAGISRGEAANFSDSADDVSHHLCERAAEGITYGANLTIDGAHVVLSLIFPCATPGCAGTAVGDDESFRTAGICEQCYRDQIMNRTVCPCEDWAEPCGDCAGIESATLPGLVTITCACTDPDIATDYGHGLQSQYCSHCGICAVWDYRHNVTRVSYGGTL